MGNNRAQNSERRTRKSELKRRRVRGWRGTFRAFQFCVLCSSVAVLSSGACHALRIVSLLPSNTEIVDALGASQDIVGVSAYDAQVSGRASVGDLVTPNLEVIVSLKPDVILAGAWKSSRVVARLRDMGYRVVEIANPHSIEEIYEDIRAIAAVIDRKEKANILVDNMRRRLEVVAAAAHTHPPIRLFIEIDRGYWTPGGADFLTEAVRAAGGQNIFSDIYKEAVTISPESLIDRNPAAVLCLGTTAAEFSSRAAVKTLEAVRERHVLEIPAELLTRPSPKLVDGIEQLSRLLLSLRIRS